MSFLPARDEDKPASRLELAASIAEVRTEIADVRGEMRTEFAAVRGEMHTEFAAVRGEMHTEFAAVRLELRDGFREQTRWIIATMLATITLATTIAALIR